MFLSITSNKKWMNYEIVLVWNGWIHSFKLFQTTYLWFLFSYSINSVASVVFYIIWIVESVIINEIFLDISVLFC